MRSPHSKSPGVCRPKPGFEKRTRLVDQAGDALAGEQPAELVLTGESVGTAALAQAGFQPGDFLAAGEKVTLVSTVTVNDNHTGTDTATSRPPFQRVL